MRHVTMDERFDVVLIAEPATRIVHHVRGVVRGLVAAMEAPEARVEQGPIEGIGGPRLDQEIDVTLARWMP